MLKLLRQMSWSKFELQFLYFTHVSFKESGSAPVFYAPFCPVYCLDGWHVADKKSMV
jgi:hypothetical protein